MKKVIAAITVAILCFVCTSVQAQKTSNNSKPNTTYVPVYEKFDTVKVASVIYGNDSGDVKYTKGFVILKGFAVLETDAKAKTQTWKWTQQPAIIGALFEDRKRPVPNYLQAIN